MILIALTTSLSIAQELGYLNVITGRPSASIFIDGELVGRDFIRKYPVMEGQHYVRVEYNGQLMYAKMVSIQPDKLTTITTENFVDIRTTTATRGAVDRESMRLRETKGNIGLGIQWGGNYPAKGMSIKWLSPFTIGLQFSAIGKTKVNDQDISEIGVRGIFPIGNKIFSGTNLSGFATVGIVNQTIDNDNGTLLGGSVGVEFGTLLIPFILLGK